LGTQEDWDNRLK